MASAMYGLGREAFMVGEIDWDGDDIKVDLCDDAYVPNLTTDEYYDDGPQANSEASSANLGSKTHVLGVADDTALLTWSSVALNLGACDEVVVWMDTGTPATSPLICQYDESIATLPVTPNGGDITCAWHASGMYAL